MFYRFAEMTGHPVGVPWSTGSARRTARPGHALDGIIAIVSPTTHRSRLLGSELRRIAEAAPGSVVLLDHVYVEYADEDSRLWR